ncbi:multifunctional acyl-CoA thioesterase I/protease I/lysophospholipase L1 [Vibrio sp. dsl-7]|uniref:Multifunctional acyl-CoA thioesterase I/protease I/lysophospholipase L1 n=1 Tax=Vibrio chanodichtyis TaxID=3027932 RepID=A0ABT5UX84_9VIBR|nr:multifunctional acyl-CoA thioesterase I/protease I/lysophospholipase L1 [Vibrio chanodichtyis]MDE1514040.1 multifunctional acyl-CoA thioesterase I/protease I/lysophospholipase L1 [Vibrio chanodichtyis]
MIRWISLWLLMLFSATASSNTLLILGDSLSAGYAMPIEQAWPSLLTEALGEKGQTLSVVNASISGDTTGNGLERLPALLTQHQPDLVLIELGANDGLRGFPLHTISQNLSTMIEQIQAHNATALLMQIRIPPNYGKRYSEGFAQIYPSLAEQFSIPLLSFFLEQVIVKPEWMMADGLHPKPEAQPWIADFVAEQLSEHL